VVLSGGASSASPVDPEVLAVEVAGAVPSVGVLAQVMTLSPERLSPGGVVEVLTALDRHCSWLLGITQYYLASLNAHSPAAGAPGLWDSEVAEATADLVGVTLHLSGTAGSQRLHTAQALTTRLPETLETLTAGAINYWQAAAIVEATDPIEDAAIAAKVEARVLARAPGQVLAATRKQLRKAVAALDPAGVAERRARNRKDRHVEHTPTGDDTAYLTALLPAEDAARAFAAVDTLARTLVRNQPTTTPATASTTSPEPGPAAPGVVSHDPSSPSAALVAGVVSHDPAAARRMLGVVSNDPSSPPVGVVSHDPTAGRVPEVALNDPCAGPVSETASIAVGAGVVSNGPATPPGGAVANGSAAPRSGVVSNDPATPPVGVVSIAPSVRPTGVVSNDPSAAPRPASTAPGATPVGDDPNTPDQHPDQHPEPERERLTLAQARADALVLLLTRPATSVPAGADGPDGSTTAPTATATAAGVGARINVTVSLETLMGLSEEPGELERYGPLSAVATRELAHAAGSTWRRLVTAPRTRQIIDVGRHSYRPPAAMADLVRARDGICTFPTCQMPATRCDLDHITAWADQGETSTSNLHAVCRRHHRLRHNAGWNVARNAATGTTTWTDPTGHRHHTPATPAL
jgi:hypothetical protein